MSEEEAKKEDPPKEEEEKPKKKDPYERYKKKEDGSDLKADPALLNGPMNDKDRGCTDIIFCLIFIVFILALLAVGIFGWWSGEPSKIMYFYDDDSRQCGLGMLSTYPYVYLYNAVSRLKQANTNFDSETFCVKTCPNNYRDPVQCIKTSKKTNCLVTYENLYLSEPFLDRICLPSYAAYASLNLSDPYAVNPILYPEASVANIIATQTEKQSSATSMFNTNFINTDQLLQYVADVANTWQIAIASVGVAFIVALIYMLVLRCCACCICYTVIFLILFLLWALGYIFQARTLLYVTEAQRTTYIAMRVFSCFFYTCACIWLIFILANCENIRLAIALIRATARYVASECCIMFVPLVMTSVFVLFMIYWVIVAVYLYSSGKITKSPTSFYAYPEWNDYVRYAFWFHVFGMFWVLAFLEAYNLFVLASSCSIWYFEVSSKQGVVKPINRSFFRGIRYHLGSLAFGSFIVALIRMAIAIVEYYKRQLEQTGGADGAASEVYKCLLRCVECCLECCLKCVEFINKHAYIQIALEGSNFLTAALNGFALIVRNLGRWTTLTVIGSFFNFLGVLFIGAGTGVVGYVIITNVSLWSTKITSPILPTIVFTIIGILIGIFFMMVYGISSDAMLHCFILDEELSENGQASHDPPEELSSFVSSERKFDPKAEDK